MSKAQPYQPSLLRFLHGLSATIGIGAIVTAALTYNTYDGRWGRLPLPKIPSIEGIHGTFGLFFLILLLPLALYSFYVGSHRLLSMGAVRRLLGREPAGGDRAWWRSFHQLANTGMLLAAGLAVVSGRQVKEEWLSAGEFHHVWYSVHLGAWVVMVVCLGLHIFAAVRSGGWPLLRSMATWRVRSGDEPQAWWAQLQTIFKRP